jgi:hypothetical protein
MPARLTKLEIREGIEFVFERAMHFARMTVAEMLAGDKNDLFCSLPAPDDRGELRIGKDAELRLRHIAHEILILNKLESLVSREAMRKLLGIELVKRFITEGRSLDAKQVDRLIAFLGREARKTCIAETHLVPCHLIVVQEPEALPVGPIVFRTRKGFRKKILPALASYDPGPNPDWGRDLMASALHYYKGFRWVADVPVVAADAKTSVDIAVEATRAALNGLQVCLGASATYKMVVGGPRIVHDRRGHLHIDPGGGLHPNILVDGPGQVGFGPGWSKQLPESDARYYLDMVGIALESAVDPTLNRPLSRRVLDAMYWFGEAVRETTDAARIVKYVTALERMLMTQEHDDIANTVSDRCAAFCLVGDDRKTLAQWKVETLSLYNLRSRLVHGDMSPLSPEVVEGVHQAAQISRMAILSAMNHFNDRDGLRQENISNKRLAQFFDWIVEQSRKRDAWAEDARPRNEEPPMFDILAKTPAACSGEELADFHGFALESGQVSPNGLKGRIGNAARLIFCRLGGALVGIAAVKRPVADYRAGVGEKAGFPLPAQDWPYELGWIFVVEPQRRKGASKAMVETALKDLDGAIFSTTRVTNDGMQAILAQFGFAKSGNDFPSDEGEYQLRLFTRPT